MKTQNSKYLDDVTIITAEDSLEMTKLHNSIDDRMETRAWDSIQWKDIPLIRASEPCVMTSSGSGTLVPLFR